jgi:hypothetical protein
MLEAAKPASADASGSRSLAGGTRATRRKRGRSGIAASACGLAVLLVAVVAITAKLMSPAGSGANSLAQAIDNLPRSGSVVLLEQERQNLIVMDAAASALTIASKPAMVNPAQVIASQSAAAAAANSSSSSGGVSAPPPDPGAAQSIGYSMLPAFGFSQSTQWSCLLDLWNQESGWIYDALNPVSGAYGIPQALPAYKMAGAGADWQTDPTTQIRWGLGYISQTYGTPCNAWAHEESYGWY